jgi:predicted aminopeptidase
MATTRPSCSDFHTVVYIPDDSSFNEAFAVTVEQEGLARWLKFRGRETDLSRYLARHARQGESMHIVARYRGELTMLYAMAIAPDLMRLRKAEVFARLVAELRALGARYGVKSALADEPPPSLTPGWPPRHLLRLCSGL